MTILDRHIAIHVIKGYLLILALLVAVFSLLDLIRELEDIGEGHYQWADACFVVVLGTPSRLIELLPITALIGSIMAMGALASRGELGAMQASGISPVRIGWSVLRPAGFLILAAVVLEQYVAPPLDQLAQTHRALAMSDKAALHTEKGIWFRNGPHFLHVGRLKYGGIPTDVDIYQFDREGRLRGFIRAKQADIQTDKQWVLTNVTQKIVRETGIQSRTRDTLVWNSGLSAEQLGILVLPPETLSLSDLYHYIHYLQQSGQNADRYESTFWQKICMPVTTGAMVMLAVPFVFGPLRSATPGRRILVGSSVGIAFYLTNQILAQLAVIYDLDPGIASVIPVVVILTLALWLFQRLR